MKTKPRRKYEGSPADIREDVRGQRQTGLSHAAYERSPRDKREDKAGQQRINKGRRR